MHRYVVRVTRSLSAFTDIEVEAKTPDSAKKKALKAANDVEFEADWEGPCNYVAEEPVLVEDS